MNGPCVCRVVSSTNADYNKLKNRDGKCHELSGDKRRECSNTHHISIGIAHEEWRRLKKKKQTNENAYIKEIVQECINLNL